MYEIEFSETAEKQFKKLERTVQERITSTLERIRFRPEAYAVKLVGSDAFKLRVGNYRIIMDIHKEKLLILVIKVGHRKNVYDK